jgi:RecB family exonuclease
MLVSCPLRHAFVHLAGLRPARTPAIPPPLLLAGNLGHRLVEELFREGAFGGCAVDLDRRAGEIFDRLVEEEASPLLLAGASFERRQLRRQLIDAVVALAELHIRRGWVFKAVEMPAEAAWPGGILTGRLDLLVERRGGAEMIIDLKWGRRRYRELLDEGRAVQLAAYAYLRQAAGPGSTEPIDAGYYSFSRAELLTVSSNGPAGLWPVLERTAMAVLRALEAGMIPVTGVDGAPALTEALGLPDLLSIPARAACEYCDHDALCGRRWEKVS